MMKRTFFIGILCSLFIGCEKSFDKFSLQRQIYIGNELRIDGYYYYIEQQSDGANKIRDISCFYRNGVLLSIKRGYVPTEDEQEAINRALNSETHTDISELKNLLKSLK